MTVNEHNIHKTKQGRPNYMFRTCTGEQLILVEITDVIRYIPTWSDLSRKVLE